MISSKQCCCAFRRYYGTKAQPGVSDLWIRFPSSRLSAMKTKSFN